MPFKQAAERELQHTRRIVCQGYKRSDGLWDIEGIMMDTKSVDMALSEKPNGNLPAGEALHHMGLRLTIDTELNIHDVDAFMDATPYKMCPTITDAFQQLIGLQIARGFTRKTRDLLGGVQGCTHLLELLGPIATTAFQSTHMERQYIQSWKSGATPPPMLNSCHSFADSSQVVHDHWPAFFKSSD